MAENTDRFVVIDGVQYSRDRATRLGLLKSEPDGDRTTETRARTSGSARRSGAGGARPTAKAQVGDGATSTGEDAKRAGAEDGGDGETPAGDESK